MGVGEGGGERRREICCIRLRSHDLRYHFSFGSFLECHRSHEDPPKNMVENVCLWRNKNFWPDGAVMKVYLLKHRFLPTVIIPTSQKKYSLLEASFRCERILNYSKQYFFLKVALQDYFLNPFLMVINSLVSQPFFSVLSP